MTTSAQMTPEDRTAHHEHIEWLDDCGRWRSEHRQTLAKLAQVQAAIMDQEAALEMHASRIESHDRHLQKYSLTQFDPGEPGYELLEQEHAQYAQKHETAKETHERIRNHHLSILSEIHELLKKCEAAM
jgi:hypothetical protein